MKIIRTIESFYPFVTGPANQAFNISKRLHCKDTVILTSDYKAKNLPAEQKYEDVAVKRFQARSSFMSYHYTPAMKKYLMEADFDLIHAHNYRSYQTEIAYLAAKKKKKPFVLSAHGSLTGYQTSLNGISKAPYWLYDAAGKTILKNADAIIVNSRQEYNRAAKFGIDRKKMHTIPVGIDKRRQVSYSKKGRLLFVGNISRNRNIEPIIRAMRQLEGFTLRIVGGEMKSSKTLKSGYIDELKALAKKTGVFDRVEFAGPKYNDELEKEYLGADIFAYTSVSENFGQTMLEAAAHGLPIICTPVGIAPELVDKKWLVDAEPRTIAEKIIQLDRQRKKVGTALRKKTEAYSWNSVISKYSKLYNKLT